MITQSNLFTLLVIFIIAYLSKPKIVSIKKFEGQHIVFLECIPDKNHWLMKIRTLNGKIFWAKSSKPSFCDPCYANVYNGFIYIDC